MAEFPALAHAAVTVSDLERSTQWYTALLGSEPVLDEDETTGGFHHTVFAIGGGQLFGLHTHAGHSPEVIQRRTRTDVAQPAGGAKNSRAMLSGSRKLTPEP